MMKIQSWISLRMCVLVLLWVIPVMVYVGIGVVAMYQTGWLWMVALSLPVVWLVAWLVGKLWKPAKLSDATRGTLLQAPEFWTPRHAAAIAVVEKHRAEAADVDRTAIADPARYQQDAQELAQRLAVHYHGKQQDHAFQPLTMIEIFAVIHLAVEDLEEWLLQNVPGSDVATIGQLGQIPQLARVFDGVQKVAYVASALFNPSKLLAYPLWRKSGRIAVEIQNELIRGLYQRYLGLIGYYLIEMYCGRLRGGSKLYHERFGASASQAPSDHRCVHTYRLASTSSRVVSAVRLAQSPFLEREIDGRCGGLCPGTFRKPDYRLRLCLYWQHPRVGFERLGRVGSKDCATRQSR
ncbi:MAG: hypothetical protein ABL921_21155 [Pirellula sp.]